MFKKISYLILAGLTTFQTISASQTLAISQEETNRPLKVEGDVPKWLEGMFVRNSAIPVYQDGKRATHKFDGLAMLHGFAFKNGEIFYSNRFLRSKEYNTFLKQGKIDGDGFASLANDDTVPSESGVQNASVNIFKYGDDYVALTEKPLPACFDIKTLNTLGDFEYEDCLPQSRCWESAHPHLDASNGEVINYLIEFGPQSYYVFYRIKEGSHNRELIGKIPVEMPSYMHSFAMTENYLILTEFPLLVRPIDLQTSGKPFIHNFAWYPEKGTRFLIVDRMSGKLVSVMMAPPFFSFHHANAYESKNEIIIDLVAHADISHLSFIFPQALGMSSKSDWKRRLMRFRLNLNAKHLSSEVLLEKEIEFPRFKDELDGKDYRYLYMTLRQNESTLGIAKLDLHTQKLQSWHQPNAKALEPIFVPDPDPKSEDAGVVLTVINDEANENAFLVILDGENFQEMARAKLPWHIPESFHGQFFSESSFILNIKETLLNLQREVLEEQG